MGSLRVIFQQFRTLFYRNLLIKFRNLRNTLMIFILPLIIVGQQTSIQSFLHTSSINSRSDPEPSTHNCLFNKASEYALILQFQCGKYDSSKENSGLPLTIDEYISPVCLVSIFSPLIDMLVGTIVSERESGLRIHLVIMGMKMSAYWMSWFAVYSIFIFLISSIIIIYLKIIEAFIYISLIDLFSIIVLYGNSMISSSFLMSTFFSNTRTAGIFSICFTIVLSIISQNVLVDGSFNLSSLIAPVIFSGTLNKLFQCEKLYNVKKISSPIYSEFVWKMNLTLFLDMIFYFVAALYFDRQKGNKSSLNHDIAEDSEESQSSALCEEIPEQMISQKVIQILNLKKIYSGDKNTNDVKALNGLTLDIFEDQITILLGVNGAGKSTLMHILCGFLTSTDGNALIHGYSINKADELRRIHSMLGVCFQVDILYNTLTPIEHLYILGIIKGIPSGEIHQKISQVLSDVNLQEKANDVVETLSGGQKRKLSVALAMIGDPKILILDEPTSGCDPVSRRHLWSVFEKKRHGKVILLSSHAMEEAEMLGDRVAIISKGKLKSVGSPLFLKYQFGVGYHLKFTLQAPLINHLTSIVTSHIPTAKLESSQGKEIIYLLPMHESKKFISLFTFLDQNFNSLALGIKSYHLSATTLEEVFLKLQKEEIGEAESSDLKTLMETENLSEVLWNVPLENHYFSKFQAMLKLRFIQKWREKSAIIMNLIFSLQLILSGCALILISNVFKLVKEDPEWKQIISSLNVLGSNGNSKLDEDSKDGQAFSRMFSHYLTIAVFVLGLAFTIMCPITILDAVRDREVQIRMQLKVFGLPFSCYWATFFFAHSLNFIIIIFIFLIFLYFLFGVSLTILYTVIFIIYIPSVLMAGYIISFIFQKSHTVQGIISVILISIAILPFIFVAYTNNESRSDALFWHYMFTAFDPWYHLIGISYFIFVDSSTELWDTTICKTLGFMVVSFTLTLCVLYKWDTELQKDAIKISDSSLSNPGDDDVIAEKNLVDSENWSSGKSPFILIKHLFKAFPCTTVSKSSGSSFKLAIEDLCLAINPGEVFGLLGPNGAGKTTTLKILTADANPTKGKVQICGHNVISSDAMGFVGYCPQFSTLWPIITLEEHLMFYAAIKGIPKKYCQQTVNGIIKLLHLEQYSDMRPSMLSGGTMRKLNYALSILGNPKILLLDEPSTGMDPWSRRFLWNTILSGVSDARSILLTTHSMEEAEALCSRIGILSRGTLRCLGSVLHLKNKYGQQYQLDLRLADSCYLKDVMDFLLELFPNAVQKEQSSGHLRYLISKSEQLQLAKVFSSLEKAKVKFKVREYTFEQASLEQVFHFITEEDE